MSDSIVEVRRIVEVPLESPTICARFVTFDGLPDDKDHFAIIVPGKHTTEPPLVRLHSECATGDIFGSRRCDCGPQLREALTLMSEQGGVIVYLRQEGRGIGLKAKLDAYALQLQGMDTFAANRALGFQDDIRSFEVAGKMLLALGIDRVRLLTNNPQKATQLARSGVTVAMVVPTTTFITEHNKEYLRAKRAHHGHVLSVSVP